MIHAPFGLIENFVCFLISTNILVDSALLYEFPEECYVYQNTDFYKK